MTANRMKEETYKKITRRCGEIISETAAGTSGQAGTGGFAEAPVRFLSRIEEPERLYLLEFLEAYIAAETEEASEFSQDLVMAANEFLMERSSISVRMMNLLVPGNAFTSIREVSGWLDRRYLAAIGYLRENMQFDGENCAAGIVQLRNWCDGACRTLIADRIDIPDRIRKYTKDFRSASFREDPLAWFQNMLEEERIRMLLIPSAILLQSRGRDLNGLLEGRRDILIRTTLLLNRFCKYPEDPELQSRLLLSFFRMDTSDFSSERARITFFNERMRFAAYAWNSNQRGCRRTILAAHEKIADLYGVFPGDLEEESPLELHLDEAILNIPAFKSAPLQFLRTQIRPAQCVHFLTMLSAVRHPLREAILRARIFGSAISTGDAESMMRTAGLLEEPDADDAALLQTLENRILHTAMLWRWNQQDCRRKVKRNWKEFEEALARTMSEEKIPEQFMEMDALFRSAEFTEDPLFAVSLLREKELSDCLGICGLLAGLTPADAARNAEAVAAWMRDSSDREACQTIGQINRWNAEDPHLGEKIASELLEQPARLWCCNVCGAAHDACAAYPSLEEQRRKLEAASGRTVEKEPADLARQYNDPALREDPVRCLRGLTELASCRLLLFIGRVKGLSPKAAIGVAVLLNGMLRYPNPEIRARVDALFEADCMDDEERYELITDYIRQEDASAKAQKRIPWSSYRKMFDNRMLWEQKNHWELSAANVRKIYAYCGGDPSAIGSAQLDIRKLCGDRVSTILRCMTGQLAVVHAAAGNEEEARFSVTELQERACAGEEVEAWTQDERDVRMLLEMASAAELLPAAGKETLGDTEMEYLDLQPGKSLRAEPVLYSTRKNFLFTEKG